MDRVGIINEIWRSISGFPDYQVSNIGRVRAATTGKIIKGSLGREGYVVVALHNDCKWANMYIHRLVAQEFLQNHDSKPYVAHVDHDRANNCFTNLRWVSISESSMNRRNWQTNGHSRYKGVSWNCRRKKWIAQIKKQQKLHFIGYFDAENEAARAYNDAAMDLFGEFARLNEVYDDVDDDATVSSEP
jgi:hypothetical protein